MSEQLLLINPRRHKRRRMPAGLARYWAKRRRMRNPTRKHARRRHRVRGYSVYSGYSDKRGRHVRVRARLSNPRRYRRRNHRHHHMRRRLRNPRMLGGLNFRSITSETVIPAGIGAVGAIGLDVVYAYATPYLPNALTTGMIPYLVKLAGALGLGMVAGKIMGRSRGHMVALGATTVVAYGAIKGALSTALPTVKGLSGYADFVDYSVAPRPPGVGAYLTTGGPVAAPAGRLGFYSPASVVGGGSASLGRGVGAYLSPGGIGGFADPSGYDWRNDGM